MEEWFSGVAGVTEVGGPLRQAEEEMSKVADGSHK